MSPQAIARLATEIGRLRGLVCRYEYDPGRAEFRYRFFRRGRFIGSTVDSRKVIAKMERYKK